MQRHALYSGEQAGFRRLGVGGVEWGGVLWVYEKGTFPFFSIKSQSPLLHYNVKAETFHPKPWFDANEQAHGYNGPLHTEPHDLAPISQLIMSSFVSKGLPHVPDMFSTGETPHGCGHAPRSVYNGLRTTSADFITNGYTRKNVTVVTRSTVDHVLVEPDLQTGELVARGVLVQDTLSGDVRAYHAKREVVICGGAYCSPAILLRSGIGPKSELQKHDIPCLIDSPGVGQNLMDHPVLLPPSSHPAFPRHMLMPIK